MTAQQQKLFDFLVDSLRKERELTPRDLALMERLVTHDTFMDLRCDWAFKHIMYDKEVLMMLIGDVLGEDIVDLELDKMSQLPNEIDRYFAGDKNATMDVVAVTKDGSRIIVEIQQQRQRVFPSRIHYYGAAMLQSELKKGAAYKKLRPVYIICFMDYMMDHRTDQLVYRYSMREETSGEQLSNLMNIYLYELPRLKKTSMESMTEVEGWLYLLKNLHNFASKPEGMNPRFDKVVDLARFHHLPDEQQYQYIRAMISEEEKEDLLGGAYDNGYDMGKMEGREEGREEGRTEVAKEMIKQGIPIETVVSCTGLSQDTILAL